jgi:hypothetical protein
LKYFGLLGIFPKIKNFNLVFGNEKITQIFESDTKLLALNEFGEVYYSAYFEKK